MADTGFGQADDPHMLTTYQAQLAALQAQVLAMNQRLQLLTDELVAKGFEVEYVGGSLVIRVPEEEAGDG
jgi:hypothetical protein